LGEKNGDGVNPTDAVTAETGRENATIENGNVVRPTITRSYLVKHGR